MEEHSLASARRKIRKQKFAILGMIVALVFAVVGGSVVEGASGTPSSLYTCTKNGVKFKVVSTPTCKAGKHPQTLNKWDNDATLGPQLATATKYEDIIADEPLTPATATFTGLSFSGKYVPVIFGQTEAALVNFSGDSFTNAKVFDLQDLNLSNANFTGATFYGADPGFVPSLGGYGRAAVGILIPGTKDDFQGANFTNAIFDGPSTFFNNANFDMANFTGATFPSTFNDANATFLGAIWSNTTCPDGTNSNTNAGLTCLGHGM